MRAGEIIFVINFLNTEQSNFPREIIHPALVVDFRRSFDRRWRENWMCENAIFIEPNGYQIVVSQGEN